MNVLHFCFGMICILGLTACQKDKEQEWMELFNGKDLSGWKASEHDSSWSVVDGVIQGVGERSHLFYEGKYLSDTFKNFELIAEVKTHKLANSGIYFHTAFMENGWPDQGIEVQVNNTHVGLGGGIELKKSGSIYGVRNIYQTFTRDSVWYTTRILVQGKTVKIWVDSMLVSDYTEPADAAMHGISPSRQIHQGTFALQCHDPLSKVHYRSIRVRRLPDDAVSTGIAASFGPWHDSLRIYQGRQFAFIDLNPGRTVSLDSMITCYYQSGINVSNVIGLEDTLNRVMLNKLTEYSNSPVFKGLKLDQSNYKQVSQEIIAPFDYVIGECSDVLASKAMLASGKIDIWAHQGEIENSLPYIKLAVKHNIAIEINNETKSPSIDFIKQAKAQGCKFSMSNLVPASKLDASLYIVEAIREAGLGYKDFYIPKW